MRSRSDKAGLSGVTKDSKRGARAAYLNHGASAAPQSPRVQGGTRLEGPVTGQEAGGVIPTVLTPNAVTDAILADMPQATVKGRAAGAGTGDPANLTQAQLTALVNTFTAALPGAVPAPTTADGRMLQADGGWTAATENANGDLFTGRMFLTKEFFRVEGTFAALPAGVAGPGFEAFYVGGAVQLVCYDRTASATLHCIMTCSSFDVSGGNIRVNGTQVVAGRDTGWTAATGTANKGAFATGTATTLNCAERIKALEDAMRAHGLIN